MDIICFENMTHGLCMKSNYFCMKVVIWEMNAMSLGTFYEMQAIQLLLSYI
jgi:hypothetical protein